MMQIASTKGCKNTNDLSKALGYKSPEKLYRLERDKNAKPSVDILADFSNEFENANMAWVLTEKGDPYISNNEKTSTPIGKTQIDTSTGSNITTNAPPTFGKSAPPNAPPNQKFGLPKVISVSEQTGDEIVSLVSVKAAAGYLNGYADPEWMEKLPTIRIPGIKGATHRAFEVRGHSMSPTLHNKSVVIGRWEESLDNIRDRRIYILVTEHDGVVIKRVLNRISESGNLILLSDNQNKKDYPNIILDASDVREMWYLRGGLMYEFPEPNEFYNRFNDLEAHVTILTAQMQKLIK